MASVPSSPPQSSSSGTSMSKAETASCQTLLKDCEMFHALSQEQISTLASRFKTRQLQRNETLIRQNEPTTSFYLLENGDIRREFQDPGTGKHHTVEFLIKAKSINSMRILSGDPAHSTVKCTSTNGCKLYEMKRQQLLQVLNKRPDIGIGIAAGLSAEVRIASKKYATPLLEQRQQDMNVPFVMIAAGIESYYRSALNAQINRALTGVTAEWFPNMHVQVPVRIAYITGFKGLRSVMDTVMDKSVQAGVVTQDKQDSHAASVLTNASLRWLMAISPGVIMTPISSILEASNAGHLNEEPMHTRWVRGIVARCGREIVFGLGLNQLSDYYEERWQEILGRDKASPVVCNAAGSLTAGVISGYFSHVPHNMSTYKLLEPHRSYADLYAMFVSRSVPAFLEQAIQQNFGTTSPTLAQVLRYTAATLFPRGLLVRTTQIVGSFMILNGTINYLQLREHKKLVQAVSVPPRPDNGNNSGNENDTRNTENTDALQQQSTQQRQEASTSATVPGPATVATTTSSAQSGLQRFLSRAD